jgi:hypothetical protein
MSANPPDTRPPALTEEQFQRFLAGLHGRGANVNVTDPRLSKAIIWLLLTVGAVTLSVGGWLVTTTIANGRLDERVVTILEQHDRRLNRLEDRRP